jgi:hypothetical protein
MDMFPQNIKKILIKIGIIIALFYVFLFFYFSYLSVPDSCYVKIKNPSLSNNKGSILEAIKLIKASDPVSFGTFCRNIDTIVITNCMGSDWHLGDKIVGNDSAGCYIKGSKTIYLNPIQSKKLSTEEMSSLLEKYSVASREFWESGL